MHAARVEQNHHGQTKDDVFLVSLPFITQVRNALVRKPYPFRGKAVLLKGVKPEFILDTVSRKSVLSYGFLCLGRRISFDAIGQRRGDTFKV